MTTSTFRSQIDGLSAQCRSFQGAVGERERTREAAALLTDVSLVKAGLEQCRRKTQADVVRAFDWIDAAKRLLFVADLPANF